MLQDLHRKHKVEGFILKWKTMGIRQEVCARGPLYVERHRLGGYPSSWFLAMVCPRQDAAGDSHLREGFHDVLKLDPDVMVATDKFIVHLATSQSTQIATDPGDEITLVLHGEIYNSTDSNPAKFLLEGYIRHDDSFAQDIDGSFVVLVIDKRKSSFSLIIQQDRDIQN